MLNSNFRKIGTAGGGIVGVKIGQTLAREILFNIGKYSYPWGVVAEIAGGMIVGALGAKTGETVGDYIDDSIAKKEVSNE